MAGAGKKTFIPGEILTAADVNSFLMDQAVMRFATASARSASLTSPSEGMVTYLDDTNRIEVYDGSQWSPVSVAVYADNTERDAATVSTGAVAYITSSDRVEFYDGSAWLPVGVGIFADSSERDSASLPTGFLAYLSDTNTITVNNGTSWVPVIDGSLLINKGYIITASAANAPLSIAPGADGEVLTVDATAPGGIKWTAPGGGAAVAAIASAPAGRGSIEGTVEAGVSYLVQTSGNDVIVTAGDATASGTSLLLSPTASASAWVISRDPSLAVQNIVNTGLQPTGLGTGQDVYPIYKAVHANGFNYIVGSRAALARSTDLVTWVSASAGLPATTAWFALTYAVGTYVVGGGSGQISTSTDGLNWTTRSNPFSSTVQDVTYGNGVFVAVGNDLYPISSTDGITWTSRSYSVSTGANTITFQPGTGQGFVAGLRSNVINFSTDGITWVARSGNSQANGTPHYVACSPDGICMMVEESTGSVWTSVSASANYSNAKGDLGFTPRNIMYSEPDSTFVISGQNGSIAVTGDGLSIRQFQLDPTSTGFLQRAGYDPDLNKYFIPQEVFPTSSVYVADSYDAAGVVGFKLSEVTS